MKKRILSLLLSLVMIVALFPATLTVYAATENGYVYTISGNYATITDYTGSATTLKIPSTLGGYNVTAIDNRAFSGSTIMTSVTIPSGITRIGEYAFSQCTALKTVSLPENLTSIAKGAFNKCTSLTSIVIPNYVTSIGDSAFYQSGLKSLTIGTKVNSIGDSAFYKNPLTSITIPKSVKTVKNNAFAYCNTAKDIYFEGYITNVGSRAFYCQNLENVHISNVEEWRNSNFEDNYANPMVIAKNIYVNGKVPTEIIIPDGATSIGKYAYYNWKEVTKVVIPESIRSIGEGAFQGCSKITNVHITNYDAWCSINFGDAWSSPVLPAGKIYINGEIPTRIKISEGTQTIKTGVYSGWDCLTNVELPETITTIGNGAFYACSGIKEINIPNNVTSIGEYAFAYCDGLTSITIPELVTNIGQFAFAACPNVNSINFNAKNCTDFTEGGLSTVGGSRCSSSVFADSCKNASKITVNIGDNVTRIPKYFIANVTKDMNVVLGRNVTEIGSYAFHSCDNLLNIDIPNKLMKVGYGAFYFNRWINVRYNGTQADWSLINIQNDGNEYFINAPKSFYHIVDFIGENGDIVSTNQCTLDAQFDQSWIPTKEENSVELYSDAEMTTKYDVNSTISQNTNIYVKYTANQYSYYFIDEDGTVLKEATIDYGAEIIPPENPIKQSSAQYSYTFTGWDGFTDGMTQTAEDLYFYATYSASVNQYTYKFVDEDGTVLKEKTVNYNTMIVPPESPSKAPDAQYTYEFAGWDGYTSGMKATSDVIFTAVYSNTTNKYTYKFVDTLGNTILEKTVDYGTIIELPADEITKAPDDEFTYTFAGWDAYTDNMTVSGDITFTPLFSKTTNKYSYKFVDEDGTVLKEGTVDYGTVITPPANPSKEANAQYTYAFKGWKGYTEGITQQAKEMVFTAEYSSTVNQYTYKFVDEDGSVIKTQTVDYGTKITPPGNPSKASTAQYNYEFTGWDDYTDGMTVTKDATFTATYKAITNQYTYKFVDYAGNVVKEATVDYGTVIVTPSTPDGYSDQQYTYIFSSWTGYVRGMKIEKDITFNARYTKVLNQYTYVFMDEKGNVIAEDTVDYGTKVTPPDAPTKVGNVQYTYEFAGWENYTDGIIVDDVIFTATYNAITNKYTYRFENEDGTEIKTVTADYGSVIEVPRNPKKDATVQYTYEFAGWNGYSDGMTLEGNITFKATYKSTINQYTYKFTDEDGTVIKELTVDYGTKIIIPETTPEKDADVQYTYTFKEWNGYADNMTVTGDVTFVAVYNSILNQYTYKFVNEDGSLVKEQKANYGSTIEIPATPSKDSTQQYSYKFIGWDGYNDGMTLTGDVVFTAKYTPVVNQYTYVFKNEDGSEIKSVTADYGTEIIVPENPTKAPTVQYSYTFANWSNYINGMSLTEDIVFVAQYTSTLNQYTYKFIDNDGTELKSLTVDYGTKIVAPSAPTDKGTYTFDYWEGFSDGMSVTADVTFKAVYKYKTYKISVEGYEISSDATYGENYSVAPAEKYGYDFVGYYTEADGKGTKLTDSNGNSISVYKYENDITVYPYFADLLVNKAVLTGATTMQVGDTDVKYTLTLGTDRNDIKYATLFVKYPNSLSISKIAKNAEFEDVIQEKSIVNGDYTTTEIIVIYSDANAMPTNTPIEVFDIFFDVSKTAIAPQNITISLTNKSVLMDSTSDYSFAELTDMAATINPKLAESIIIEGDAIIDSATKYTAVVLPDYTTDKKVIWTVNDTSVATITDDGTLTPIKNGTVIITAKSLSNPEVFATKEVSVKAYAKVASISTDGFWTEAFKDDVKHYTVYVDENTTEFNITPVSASGGHFNINGSTVFSNRTKTIELASTETEIVITLFNATGYTDNTYTLTVIKNSDALITEVKTTESGYEFDVILNKDKIDAYETAKMVVALYDNNGKFICLAPATVSDSDVKKIVPIITEMQACTAKVMLWNDINIMKPLCIATEITIN